MTVQTEPDTAVLLATGRARLLDDLRRLAVAADVQPVVVEEPVAARRWWSRAGLVVLGPDLAAELVRAPVRRDGVVLVGSPHEAEGLFETAVSIGAERVVVLPEDEGWLVEQLTRAGDRRGCGVLVAVVGCRGGAGASTVVGALARQSVRDGLRAVVVDVDPGGADLDLLLDLSDEPGLRWADLASARGRLPEGPLASALPQRDGVALLRADPVTSAGVTAGVDPVCVRAVVDALRRAFDLVLVDVPRWCPDQARPVLDRADALVLVTTADPRGVVAARRAAERLATAVRPTYLVVRTGRAATIDPVDVATAVDLPLTGLLRHDRRVAADAARGDLVVRPGLRRTVRALLLQLATAAGGAP